MQPNDDSKVSIKTNWDTLSLIPWGTYVLCPNPSFCRLLLLVLKFKGQVLFYCFN